MPNTPSRKLTDETKADAPRLGGGEIPPLLDLLDPARGKQRPLATDFAGAEKLSGLSRSALYLAAARGELAVRKWGSRAIIMVDDLEAYLRSLPLGSFSIPPSHQARADRKERESREGHGGGDDSTLRLMPVA